MQQLNEFDIPDFEWKGGIAKTITFIVTEDCQLACNYCYLVHKNKRSRMNFKIAKQTIDYILENRDYFDEGSVIWEFIGGEPFLEIELIDKITDYIKLKMYADDHPWFNSYRLSFSTNGLMYDHPKVQRYISKNLKHLSLGISIDGTRKKHDKHRIFPNGKGSYDDVVKNIPLWMSQFPSSATKVTVGSEDLIDVKESVIHLWSLGIKYVNINVVFEDLWKEDDHLILEEQLISLADYVLENRMFVDHTCSFFDRGIGKPLNQNKNWCGAGKMVAVDHLGNFYPCIRFTEFSLQNKKPRIIGNCFDGINHNILRPFLSLDLLSQSCKECVDCDIGIGCAWCQGANYDFADTDTIYQRATYICKMHNVRVKANNYFWSKYDQLMLSEEDGNKR